MKKAAKIGIAVAAVAVIGAGAVTAGLFASGRFGEKPSGNYEVSYEGIEVSGINAKVAVHDPSIIEGEDGKFYIFGSHMTAAESEDLRVWNNLGSGYTASNQVYTDLASENKDSGEFDYAGSGHSIIPTDDGQYHVWAPDVIYNKALGKYFMYYCTSSTWNASNLCYATSDKIEGPYEWQGALICSGFGERELDKTDVLDYVSEDYAIENYIKGGGYNFEKYPNAIDPTVFYDKDGKMWMVYGSWSGGIFLLEIDEQTGLVIHPEADPENNVDPYFGKRLLGGGHKSIEGPFIIYDEDSDYYYLYVSYGALQAHGGYQIRVFRSKTPDGDYVDMNGQYPTADRNHAYYGLKLSGNYYLPSLLKAYMATGHDSVINASDGKKYNCYHTRFNDNTENHAPRVKQFFMNEEGWPCLLPYATDGETISENGYSKSEVVGTYYMIDQGMAIDDTVAEPVMIELTKGGHVFGEDIEGTWEMKDGSYYVHITIGEVEYSGVFCKQNDEAGTEVMTFTAVGNNESIWGVKYDK